MHKKKKDSPLPFSTARHTHIHMRSRCQQTTTRVQLVRMLRNMTDYSNMYNTIPNCLQEKKKKKADGAVYLIEPMTLNNHRLGIAIKYIYMY